MLLVLERTLKVRVGFGGIGPLVFYSFQRLEICFQFMSVLLVFFFFRFLNDCFELLGLTWIPLPCLRGFESLTLKAVVLNTQFSGLPRWR